jgi:hypothetical protein
MYETTFYGYGRKCVTHRRCHSHKVYGYGYGCHKAGQFMAGFSENNKHPPESKIVVYVPGIDDLMMEAGVQRGAPIPAAAQYATPTTQRRGIDGALKLEAAAAVENACRGYSETTAPLRRPATATAAAVDSLNGARKCNVATTPVPVVPTPHAKSRMRR